MAIRSLERTSSPWRPELKQTLQHLVYVARRHENWVASDAPLEAPPQPLPAPTPSTALGHHPKNVTVPMHATHTDAGLSCLESGD